MSATTTRGYRHECPSRISVRCDQGHGRAPRKRCRVCGSELRTISGLYGVFAWTGEGRYPRSAALSVWETYAAAERHTGDSYVVRFLVGESR